MAALSVFNDYYQLSARFLRIAASIKALRSHLEQFIEPKSGTILLLSPFEFSSRRQGGAIRTHNIISCLKERFNVVAVEFCWSNTADLPFVHRFSGDSLIIISCRHLDSSTGGEGSLGDRAFSSWLTPEMTGLVAFLHEIYMPKMIWCEFSYMAMYSLPCLEFDTPYVLSLHNIESSIVRQLEGDETQEYRIADRSQHPGTSNALASLENKLISRFNYILATTNEDAGYCAHLNPNAFVMVAPNIVTMATDYETHLEAVPRQVQYQTSTMRLQEPLSIIFVGDCLYTPNRLGILWFMNDIYDELSVEDKKLFTLKFYGNGSLDLAYLSKSNVDFLGFADSIDEVYNAADAALVPLLHGGGSRLKIHEAIERMVTIITTPKGAEGIDMEAISPYSLFFDNSRDFANSVKQALLQRADPSTYEDQKHKYQEFLCNQNNRFTQAINKVADRALAQKVYD
ncbi:MAG: glycosyltransferase family 4 protein [Prochlorococcaceae cyanobacterium]|jgi:hypothetical protein